MGNDKLHTGTVYCHNWAPQGLSGGSHFTRKTLSRLKWWPICALIFNQRLINKSPVPKLPSAALFHRSRGSSPELCLDSSWLQAPCLTCCRHLREALLLQAGRWLSGCFLGCKGLSCLALVLRSTADLRWSWRNICISAQLPLHIWVLQNESSCRFRLSEVVCKGTSSST